MKRLWLLGAIPAVGAAIIAFSEFQNFGDMKLTYCFFSLVAAVWYVQRAFS